jgi:hypothetical protein
MATDDFDDDRDDRPIRRRGPSGDAARGREKARGPGTWLTVAAAVMFLTWVANIGVIASGYDVSLAITELFAGMVPANDPQRPKIDQQLEEMRTRDRTAETVQAAGLAAVNLAANVVVLLAGLRLKQTRSRGLVMAGSILAMIPCNSCCLIGLPIGIWAITTLGNADVKAAFAAASRPQTFDDDLDDRR